jgi:two-component system NarL family sensor kinase
MESKEIDIIIVLIGGTLVMLLMIAVVIYSVVRYQKRVLKQREVLREVEKKYQNDLLDATITATEKEREVVAKNIHDDIGSLINIIKMNNSTLKNYIVNEPHATELIQANNQIAIEIYENIRSIYNDLMSPTLVKFGFVRALSQFCQQITKSKVVKVVFDPIELNLNFSDKMNMHLYRVCKEVINNVIKHSESKEIIVTMEHTPESLVIKIKHEGKGINDEDVKLILQNNQGLGLKSLYGRMQILDGSINYISKQGEESLILIRIPIK